VSRVVVFGSTGMVGRAVAAKLGTLSDLEAIAVNRRDHGFDVTDRVIDTPALLRDATFAVNCIGLLRGDRSYGANAFQHKATLVNSLWPQRLAEAAAVFGCRVIHLSTDGVFAPGVEPADETTPISPSEIYGLSKALGEVNEEHVINLRFSVIGPAPDRGPSLWEWLIRQPRKAVVPGYATFGWTGCTSLQLAGLVADLVRPAVFDTVRSAGAVRHFLPNGTTTKFAVLELLASFLRPDLTVIEAVQATPNSRVLTSSAALNETIYTGSRGWSNAIRESI